MFSGVELHAWIKHRRDVDEHGWLGRNSTGWFQAVSLRKIVWAWSDHRRWRVHIDCPTKEFSESCLMAKYRTLLEHYIKF
jgi:hypothetical protein